ncbi:MAG: ABC transporter ATP-binding protein [Alphaproteobacteria bacterium]
MTPLLALDRLEKRYTAGWPRRRTTFQLSADIAFESPQIVGVMGPNGAGKTTLFEMIAGGNRPSAGRVLVAGRDVHRVKYRERDRLAIHYHQSYQVRRFRRTVPSAMLAPAGNDYPLVHLFDEPQFNTQDGYIGFMLAFFRRLRAEGRLVVVCLHPTARWQLDLLREICERFVFVGGGTLTPAPTLDALAADPRARAYLGELV